MAVEYAPQGLGATYRAAFGHHIERVVARLGPGVPPQAGRAPPTVPGSGEAAPDRTARAPLRPGAVAARLA
jgi:hypothetical protein